MAKIKCWGKVQLKNFETNEGSSNIYSEYEQTYETSIEKKIINTNVCYWGKE